MAPINSSWWFSPTQLKIYAQVKLDHFPNFRGKNRNYLKPAPRISLVPKEKKQNGSCLDNSYSSKRLLDFHQKLLICSYFAGYIWTKNDNPLIILCAPLTCLSVQKTPATFCGFFFYHWDLAILGQKSRKP